MNFTIVRSTYGQEYLALEDLNDTRRNKVSVVLVFFFLFFYLKYINESLLFNENLNGCVFEK